MKEIVENYHADALASFRNYKKMAERAIEQVSDGEFFRSVGAMIANTMPRSRLC